MAFSTGGAEAEGQDLILRLHKYDERDIDRADRREPVIVYSCHEDEFRVVYLFDESEREYRGEMREAA